MAYLTPGALVFSRPDELASLLALVVSGHHSRKRDGYPVTPLQRQIVVDATNAYQAARGHTDDRETPVQTQLLTPPEQQCGTEEAANLLGLSQRQTRRYATRLGARRVTGRLIFDRTTVQEFAEELQHERQHNTDQRPRHRAENP